MLICIITLNIFRQDSISEENPFIFGEKASKLDLKKPTKLFNIPTPKGIFMYIIKIDKTKFDYYYQLSPYYEKSQIVDLDSHISPTKPKVLNIIFILG